MIFHQASNSSSNYNFNTRFYTDTIWESHFHKNLELIYVIKGTLNCTINNVPYKMTAGDFGLCLPYDIHSYVPDAGCEYWILVFSEDFVHSFSKEISGKTADRCIFKVSDTVKAYIIKQLIYNETPTRYTLKSCLYAVCDEFLSSVNLIKKDRKKSEIISLIADYVSEKHTENISLNDIASTFCYDYNYMSRCFKNMFNMSFTNFVNLYRLETAIRLLETTNKGMAEIAMNSGFQSVRNFNNIFIKNLNMSPSQYRKASRK